MNSRLLRIILGLLIFTLISCDGGGGGGGTVLTEYLPEHLDGTWHWTMTGASGSTITGTIVLGGGAILAITNSSCSHIADGWMKLMSETYIKGRNLAWCTDTTALMKFALSFYNTNYIAGIMDYHPASGGYKRYDWVMTK